MAVTASATERYGAQLLAKIEATQESLESVCLIDKLSPLDALGP
jgi:hypothetical protein